MVHDSTSNPPGLRALVYARIPREASPTDTYCQPIPGRVLQMAQGDVVDMAAQRMSEQLGATPHVVLVLRDGDLDPATDADVLDVLRGTDGGVLVFGVTYREGKGAINTSTDEGQQTSVHEECPECGSMDAFEVKRATTRDTYNQIAVLVECRACGAVWDSVA